MKRFVALLLVAILMLSCACAESAADALQEMYAQAELLMVQGDYAGAAAKFDALGAYADASQMAMYCKAVAAAESLGLYSMAVDAFEDLGDFKDSRQMAQYYEGRAHEAAGTVAVATASDADLVQALWQLEEAQKVYGGLAFFKDSLTRYAACGERMKEIQSEQSRRAQTEREKELARMEGVYQQALTLEQSGDYAGAIELYRSIHGYKDSAERIASCETADVTVGSCITFGAYEQDHNTANGKESIEWLVLAKEDNRLLVISQYALDCQPYNVQSANVTWETCTLRSWLNKDFLDAAFSSGEQEMILAVTVSADKNPECSTNPGKATQDKVFLLSINEANKYFENDRARQCKPTDYAEAQGVTTHNGGCWWWLRSPGYQQNYAADVFYDGKVGVGGFNVGWTPGWNDNSAVRPAMWIELAP